MKLTINDKEIEVEDEIYNAILAEGKRSGADGTQNRLNDYWRGFISNEIGLQAEQIKELNQREFKEIVSQQLAELKKQPEKQEGEPVDIKSIEARIKGEAENLLKTERQKMQSEFIRASAVNNVMAEAVKLGLTETGKKQKVFEAAMSELFSIEAQDNKYFFRDKKGVDILSKSGEVAGPAEIALAFKESAPDLFVSKKEGFGAVTPAGSSGEKDWSKMSAAELMASN